MSPFGAVLVFLLLIALGGSLFWGILRGRLPHVGVGWAWTMSYVVLLLGFLFTMGTPAAHSAWSGVVLLGIGIAGLVGSSFAVILLAPREDGKS